MVGRPAWLGLLRRWQPLLYLTSFVDWSKLVPKPLDKRCRLVYIIDTENSKEEGNQMIANTECESCLIDGLHVPATTRSSNPNWEGYNLCEACAAEYDSRIGKEEI